ncbi:MAG: outer membrane lipoprotein carrier protein LolA [Paracoccaceae bacterium]|nr:outer membrane lipoprotein carrier protein LolA [Paracoccaceae bacterium]MDE3120541.1 outer membrane lipoprotein carrier protein LolA [Paracoccaceae bacterium]MDE3239741.1 outer membrane lipoprotein carrier protein LolA [Paracoccaceae bacterium]
MTPRSFFAAVALTVAAALVAPLSAAAQALSLDQLSTYLNGLDTATATFRQENADGSTSTGKLYLHRPYRMRFEYDPPDRSLVIASSRSVAVFDPKSNQPPEEFPLSRTPLNLILGPHIDLTQARMVVSHYAEGANTVVVAEDPEHPDYGTIKLVFSDSPVALRQWVVTDQAGGVTSVTLSDFKTGMTLGDTLFDIQLAAQRRAGR